MYRESKTPKNNKKKKKQKGLEKRQDEKFYKKNRNSIRTQQKKYETKIPEQYYKKQKRKREYRVGVATELLKIARELLT
jgi:hypothetical protein